MSTNRGRELVRPGSRLTIIGVGVALLLVIVAVVMTAASERIEAGNHCVTRLNGRSTGTAAPGWEWMVPGVESLRCYQTSLITMEYTGAEGSQAQFRDAVITEPSSDGVDVNVAAYAELRIQPERVRQLHDDAYRTTDAVIERIVQPMVRDSVREVVASTPIQQIYPGGRPRLAQQVETLLVDRLDERGISLVSLRLTGVDPDDEYEAAVRQQQQAAEDRELAVAQQAVAEERATTARIEAEGRADVQRAEAQGEADANQTINASLTPAILQLEYYRTLGSINWAIFSPEDVQPTVPLATPSVSD